MKCAAPALLLALAAATSACAPAAQTACVERPAQPAATAAPAQAPSVPLDLPTAASWTGTLVIFAVDVDAGGRLTVNGERLGADGELQVRARLALAQHPELRAVIRADQAVPHGRVIHVLDLLKQAGVGKIAFGVSVSPGPGAVGSAGPPPAPAGGSPVSLGPGSAWACPYPPEADQKGIDAAEVAVVLIVGADGALAGARVVEDPGNGFGATALRCAVARTYGPATDARGVAVASTTTIRIRFTR
jgi:biopolymer transport protein ExbD